MNLIEITLQSDSGGNKRNMLINLDRVSVVRFVDLLVSRQLTSCLLIETSEGEFAIYDKDYSIALYQQLQKLSIQNWTQEELS